MGRLALFDLDRTLIDCNSGRLWALAEWREGRVSTLDLAWALSWLARYALGAEAGIREAFEAATASIAGQEEQDLERRIRAWFEREVAHRLRAGGREALARHREAGDHLVLATSGSIYAARAAAERYGLDEVVATRFEVVDGRFTGRVSTLAVGEGKAEAVEAWASERGHSLRDAAFYTDSMSDRTLMERVGEPVAVHPDRALRREAALRGWRVERW
jgi:HAD superfamily hydrolase (TIGR01490 family)